MRGTPARRNASSISASLSFLLSRRKLAFLSDGAFFTDGCNRKLTAFCTISGRNGCGALAAGWDVWAETGEDDPPVLMLLAGADWAGRLDGGMLDCKRGCVSFSSKREKASQRQRAAEWESGWTDGRMDDPDAPGQTYPDAGRLRIGLGRRRLSDGGARRRICSGGGGVGRTRDR